MGGRGSSIGGAAKGNIVEADLSVINGKWLKPGYNYKTIKDWENDIKSTYNSKGDAVKSLNALKTSQKNEIESDKRAAIQLKQNINNYEELILKKRTSQSKAKVQSDIDYNTRAYYDALDRVDIKTRAYNATNKELNLLKKMKNW